MLFDNAIQPSYWELNVKWLKSNWNSLICDKSFNKCAKECNIDNSDYRNYQQIIEVNK